MCKFLLLVGFLASVDYAFAQTTSITSGNWADGTVWSTGTVPGATTTVTVNHPETLDANISISTGSYTFNASCTDFTGGTAQTLAMTGGTLVIGNGSNTPTVTFEGSATFTNATVTVSSGATLILGATTFNNGNTVVIQAGGTLIVNGTLLNSNSSGSITIGGLIYVNGDYDTNNGNLSVTGGGDLFTTGSISNQGSSNVFGSNNDCNTGPCSGQNLCTGQSNTVTPMSQFICSGGSISLLNGNAMTNVTYQWQSSTTSAIASDFTNIPGATTEDYTPSIPSVTTWYRRVATSTSDATCFGRSLAAQVTIASSSSWSGATSTDWHTPSNWCGGVVPTTTTDVVINSNATRQPTISTGTANVRNLTISSGAVLTITDQNLIIRGDLVYNGSFVYNGSVTGRIFFSGTTSQTISGSTPYIFNNLTFNNNSGSTPNITFSGNAITVNKNLSMTAGVVNLSGYNITIGTSTSAAGTVGYTSGRIYNGNITRWFGTSAVTVETAASIFPLGTVANNRPFYLGFTGLSTGGTVRVQHTGTIGSTAASFSDVNPAATIQVVSNSIWTLSTANGLSLGSNTFNATAGGTGLGLVSDAVNHLRLTQASASMGGSAGTNDASTTDLRVRRTGFTFLSNPFNLRIASSNSTLSSLPITLTSFTVQPTHEGARLQWTTSMEKDFNFFAIERSENGVDFEQIAITPSQGGESVTTNYGYTDGTVNTGRFYYRLKSVDYDGQFEYSEVVRVDMDGKAEIASIFPNPSTGKFTVNIFQGKFGKVIISDMYGKVIAHVDLQKGYQDINIEHLPAGVYFARIQTEAGQQATKLVVRK